MTIARIRLTKSEEKNDSIKSWQGLWKIPSRNLRQLHS